MSVLLAAVAGNGCGGDDLATSSGQQTTDGDGGGSLGSSSTGASSGSGAEGTADVATTVESTSRGTTEGSWPGCEPWEIQSFYYSVGPDDWGNYQPDVQWPPGHHAATCTIISWDAEPIPDAEGLWANRVDVEGCLDQRSVPAPRSLDLILVTSEALEPPLAEGQSVTVSYSVMIWASYQYQSWYSLRDADTGELLLAAFADPGPDLAPKVLGEPTLGEWLAPFEASLGPFACPIDEGPFCEADHTPQRAFVEFTRDGEVWSVVGGTIGQLPGYVVYLGFAGAPDVCEQVPTQLPIHGVLVKDG